MREISIREMRANLGRLAELMEREGELVLTRRGQAIARIVSVAPRRRMASHADLRRKMPRLSPSEDLIREDRDGR